jgi:hypothetical protein
VIVPAATAAETAEEDLSVGVGNVEQPPIGEPTRRRARGVHTRARSGGRKPRRKAE